jgi:hypothetical protein
MGCLFDFGGLGSLSFLSRALKLDIVDVLKLDELSDMTCFSDGMMIRLGLVFIPVGDISMKGCWCE